MARRRGNNNKKQQHQQQHQHGQQEIKKRSPKIVDTINESDDEEIPEDEAFNSEDERLYGHFFKSVDDDDDDEGEESDEDEEAMEAKESSKKKRKQRSELDSSEDEEVTSGEEEEDDESESESDSDDDGDEDDEDDDDDDEDDDGGQYMLDLLNKIDEARSRKNGGHDNGVSTLARMLNVSESNYSSKQGNLGSLTLDKLMEGIQDTQGFRELQKTFANQRTTTPAPLAKTVSNRIERKMAYSERSKDMTRWTKVIQENRRAETLDFKPKDRLGELTRDAIVDKFEAKTDFEKEIEQALEEAGQQDGDAVFEAEEKALQDDLGANRLTMEEYKKRRGQLAQIRALMFYHEQKRHHIKKIKSKKYRRIRKKQRERLKESEMEAAIQDDEELAKELQEKEETARIKERMTLAHKNTSKWAKRILKRGKNVSLDQRRELSAQIKRGDDLRRKMMGNEDDINSQNGDSDNEDLADSTRKVLQTIEDGPDPTHGRTGLFKLSFMQKAIQKQRETARDEAQQLLDTINADEMDDYDEAMKNDDYDDVQVTAQTTAAMATEKEMKNVLDSGEMVATSLEFGNSNSISTSGGIEIDMGDDHSYSRQDKSLHDDKAVNSNGKRGVENVFAASQFSTTLNITTGEEPKSKSNKRKAEVPSTGGKETKPISQKATVATVTRNIDDEEEVNPWLQASETNEESENPSSASKAKKVKRSKGVVDIEGAVNMLDSGHSKSLQVNVSEGHSANESNDGEQTLKDQTKKKLTMLTQEELVRQAFVKEDEKYIDEEFQREKQAMADSSDPTRKVEKDKKSGDVSGWGSWAGQGVAFPSKPRKFSKKFEPPKKKKEEIKEKRPDHKKPNVIINSRRIKKTANQFMLGDVPYPYSSRAEYEQAMLGLVGKEWNVSSSFKSMTRPEILTRSGKIIQPISKKAKTPRPAAKF